MRAIAAQISTHLCRRKPVIVQSRKFCSYYYGRDEQAMEEEAERKIGWFFKLLFAGTATFVGYQFFPYLGDNLVQQSVSLLQVKDPLFKRIEASRLARFAIDGVAKDDCTRKEALRALVSLSHSDEAVWALHNAGAISVIRSTPDSIEDAEVEKHKLNLLKRFEDLRYDDSSLGVFHV